MAPHHPGICNFGKCQFQSGKAHIKEARDTCVVEILRGPPTAARMQTPYKIVKSHPYMRILSGLAGCSTSGLAGCSTAPADST